MSKFLLLIIFVVNILNANIYTIYVNSHLNSDVTLKKWNPTIEYLNEKIPNHTFKLLPIRPNEVQKIKNLLNDEKIDFLITQPAIFSELKYTNGVNRVLTMTNRFGMNKFGSVLITHKDSSIENILDIKGKSVAAVAPLGFGGWLIGYNEMYERGVDPLKDKKVSFTGSQKKVVNFILNKKYDVGVIKTGMLENLSNNHNVDISDIKIINEIESKYPLKTSSKLYAEWTFAIAEHVKDDKLKRDIFKAMNIIAKDSQAAIVGQYQNWSLPQNYTDVDDLLKKFRLAHYKDMKQYTTQDVIEIIVYMFILAGILFIILLVISFRNKLLSAQLGLQNKVASIGLIIDKSLNEVFIFNESDYKFTYLNHGALKNIGYTLEEMQSMTPLDIKPEYTYEMFQKVVEPLYKEDKKQVAIETVHQRKDGSLYPVEIRLQLMELDNKKQFVAIILDISQRKKDEQKIKEEVEKNRKKDRQLIQQSRLAQMGEMISMIAHQWRQPISAIAMGANNILADIELDSIDENTLKDSANNIAATTKELSKTIDDFRNFYKPNKQSVIIKLEDVIEKSLNIVRTSLINNSINIIEEYNSKEEIELMNMKLKFAFGKLQPADKLLDNCILEEKKVEIRNGVFIQRKENNIFVITYKEQSVEVDLNLSKNQTYPSPYVLPQYKVKRDYFSVIHTGQGDGWDVNRPSMNSIISFQGKLYVIDVVPNFTHILNALSIDINEIEGVFQTHTHDDHLAGITSLIRSDKKIKFYASKLVISATAKKLSALLDFNESEFYNLVDVHELEIDKWNDICGLEVKPYISPHPVETTIFVFRTLYGSGYKTYGHFADIIDIDVLRKMIVTNSDDIGISEEFFKKVIENYSQKLDLKKIDIGGGMIHGNAKDFWDDKTSKIVLAHNSNELSHEEKRIGSGSLFGLSDVLIPSNSNYDLSIIYSYLRSNFPHLHDYDRKVFLNFNIVSFNPEAIIIQEGEDIKNAYLIIHGQIEKIKENVNDNVTLTPGIIIGEKTALTGKAPNSTHIAKNFVKLLEIPIDFFYNFINKHKLINHMLEKSSKKLILQKTDLFREAITYSTLNEIAVAIQEHEFKKHMSNILDDKLYIIVSGEVVVKVNNAVIETVTEFGYFGGVHAVLDYPLLYNYEFTEDTIVYSIPGDFLRNIPIVRWKILEKNELLKQKLFKIKMKDEYSDVFLWNEAYKINVREMDNHHKRLFDIIENLNDCLKSDNHFKLPHIVNSLVKYTKYHFSAEEKFLKEYKYVNIDEHKKAHREFIRKLYKFRDDITNNTLDTNKLMNLLNGWLVNHILEEDTKYGKILNEKGVF